MSTNNETKNIKIGAKKLTTDEVINILPTYNKLISQLEEFREYAKNLKNDKSNKEKDSVFSSSQVMNNIAIIGERGSGKTSIMKTIDNHLKENNKQGEGGYLILPIIIPENMPDTMTVIACFLGLLKDCVDEIVEEEKKADEEKFYCFKNHEIEKDFNKLIKNFGYLQKRYQEIAVNTYTTESNYVEETKKMFSANNKFVQEFNKFIDTLLEKSKKDILLIFIDDVDLSVNKSLDIIKTLLIYLSNPKIATIIACDLNTFQEAVTLEFTKQDNLKDSDFLKFDYINGIYSDDSSNNDISKEYNLLKRKSKLTYEYLKKILPPVYRHNVNKWDLEIRHKYFYDNDAKDNKDNSKEEKKFLSLLELLKKLSDKNELLEKYFCVEKDGKEQPIMQIFNIFDSTSRGLNNVYSNIYELIEAPIEFYQAKLLLENIVYSNPTLNNNRELIFGSLLKFGIDLESSTINFETLNKKYNDALEDNEEKSIEYFIIFTFLDFSYKLLGMNYLKYNEYEESKKNALKCLFYYPQISGRNINYTYLEEVDFEEFKLKSLKVWYTKSEIKQSLLDLYLNLEFEKAIVYFNEINFEELFKDNLVLRTKYFLKTYSILKMVEKPFEKSELNKYINKTLGEKSKDYKCINLTKYLYNASIKEFFNMVENELFADKNAYLRLLLIENNFVETLKSFLIEKYSTLILPLSPSDTKFTTDQYEEKFKEIMDRIKDEDDEGINLKSPYRDYLIQSLCYYRDFNFGDYVKLVYNYIDEEYTKEFINENTFLEDFKDFKDEKILEKEKGVVDYLKKITYYNLWNYNLTENIKRKIDKKIKKFANKNFITETILYSDSRIKLKIDDVIKNAIEKMKNAIEKSPKIPVSDVMKCKFIFEELDKSNIHNVYKYFIFDACLKYLLYTSEDNYERKEARESLKELDKIGLDINFGDKNEEYKQKYKFLLYCYLYKNKFINPYTKDIDLKLRGEFLDSIKYSKRYLNEYELKDILENIDEEGQLFIEEIRNNVDPFEDEDEE